MKTFPCPYSSVGPRCAGVDAFRRQPGQEHHNVTKFPCRPGLSIPQESARIEGEFWPLGLLMSCRVNAVPRGPWQFGTNPPRMGGGGGARVPLLPPSRT